MAGSNLILGVTGGIAAYKSCELVRRAQDAGYSVRVVMTSAAQAFVAPLTFQALSGNPVHTELLDESAEAGMGHIELARWADHILIAPATADFIAKLAAGRADDLLSTLSLASKAPVIVAPAMNQAMWSSRATQRNVQMLEQMGVLILQPGTGEQACGDVGPGRMMEPDEILTILTKENNTAGLLAGRKLLITGGPTREPLDPVRFISNHSSGRMAYSLAISARNIGAEVCLISGPVQIPAPLGVEVVYVERAEEMLQAVMERIAATDIFIAAAAVSDYRPANYSQQKIKKVEANLQIELERNPDILRQVGALEKKPLVVGFAAESEHLLENARRKLQDKGADLLIANDISRNDIGFDSDENECWLIQSDSEILLEKSPKPVIAQKILEYVQGMLTNKS